MEEEMFLSPCKKAFAIHRKSPYGDMWRKMSYHELASIASYKARRATLLQPNDSKIEDDILDALNFLIFAWLQIEGRSGIKEVTDGTEREDSAKALACLSEASITSTR